ncbi:hypothetical protein [Actinopolyspora mortivallis]|uniref:hypothetical protein n=1 Tax=Actinopolyspora mortivallis TaxID=33906 RepID=UPI00038139DA|nr:hypothetical protein [Actinopolyspora mortivallis]
MTSQEGSRVPDGWKAPTQIALAYGILYVAITLAIGHTVQLAWLALPFIALWALTAVLTRFGLLQRRPVFLGLAGVAVVASVLAAVAS